MLHIPSNASTYISTHGILRMIIIKITNAFTDSSIHNIAKSCDTTEFALARSCITFRMYVVAPEHPCINITCSTLIKFFTTCGIYDPNTYTPVTTVNILQSIIQYNFCFTNKYAIVISFLQNNQLTQSCLPTERLEIKQYCVKTIYN